ncbi:hypothetical protein [Actinomadura craniellae]|uniref:hypothetical protein n=1 Tax=Actinomadura craniellae TaxID=2231787 RepID=UPI0018F17BF3|nr:hypothetical protein [Actinomadura craniellae]
MTTIGIVGADAAGSQITRAAIANSRGPETLKVWGPSARAAHTAGAAADFAVIAIAPCVLPKLLGRISVQFATLGTL